MQSEDCTIRELVRYMRERAWLRDTQVDAIETFIYLNLTALLTAEYLTNYIPNRLQRDH